MLRRLSFERRCAGAPAMISWWSPSTPTFARSRRTSRARPRLRRPDARPLDKVGALPPGRAPSKRGSGRGQRGHGRMAAILRSVCTAVDTQAPDRELNHASRLLEGLGDGFEGSRALEQLVSTDLPRGRKREWLGSPSAVYWSSSGSSSQSSGVSYWASSLPSSVSSRSEDSLVGAGTDPGPDVLPDPPLEPTRPGEPPVIDTPQLPDPAEPWNEPETPEPPTPRPPRIPDDQLGVRADRRSQEAESCMHA